MKITKITNLETYWEKLEPLFAMNFYETGFPAPLNICKAYYLEAFKAGDLHIMILEDDNQNVFGYSFFKVFNPVHYRGTLFAFQDAFFVKKEYRGVSAMKLFKAVEKDLENMGVQCVIRDSDLRSSWNKTLEKSGYKELKKIFFRKIGV